MGEWVGAFFLSVFLSHYPTLALPCAFSLSRSLSLSLSLTETLQESLFFSVLSCFPKVSQLHSNTAEICLALPSLPDNGYMCASAHTHTDTHSWKDTLHVCLSMCKHSHKPVWKHRTIHRKIHYMLASKADMWHTSVDLHNQDPYTHTACYSKHSTFVLTMNQHSAWIIGLHYGFSSQPTYSLDIVQRNRNMHTSTLSC